MSDFLEAVKTASSWSKDFLMIGRRCDVDITEPIDFSKARWEKYLKAIAFEKGRLHGRGIDYFVFSRGLYKEMPPLVIGRNWWDNWLVWKARSLKVPVIDASGVVTAIHHNHDYSYHPEGLRGIVYDSGSRYNLTLGGTWRHFHMLEDAPYRLTPDGVSKNPAHIFNGVRREARHMWDVLRTRSLPVRERIGLNRKNINRFFKPHEDRDKDIWRSQ